MTKNEEKRERKERFKRQVREAMREKNVTPRDIELATGLPYHAVNDAIHKGASARTDNIQRVADCLEMDISWLPVSTVKPPVEGRRTPVVKPSTGKTPVIGKAKVTRKEMNDGRYIVTTKGETFERTEILTKEEVEGMEGKEEKATVEPVEEVTVPTMTDDDPALEMNTKEIWVDGKKYTEDTIRIMVESAVSEHREHVELLDKVNDLQTQLEEKTKEAIHWQVQMEEHREQLAEVKQQEDVSLKDMTIGESIKLYRTLKKLFKDEVLQ